VNAATIPPQTVLPTDNNTKNPTSPKSGDIGGNASGGTAGFDAILAQVMESRTGGEPPADPRSLEKTLNQSLLATAATTTSSQPKQTVAAINKRDAAGAQSGNTEAAMTPTIAQQISINAALSSLAALPNLTAVAAATEAPSGDATSKKSQRPSLSVSAKTPASGIEAGPSRALAGGPKNELARGSLTQDAAAPKNFRNPQNQAFPFAQPVAPPATRIVATHVETHFAPTANLSPPTQQVADAVLNRLGGDSSPDPTAGSALPTPQLSTASPNSTLKVLTVQLEPADLGSVAIKMRLTGNHLDMEVMAAQHDTLRALSNDHDRLRDTLQSCGYSIDNLSIKASPSAQSGSSDNQNPSQRNPQNQPSKDAPSGFSQSGSERGNSRERTPKEHARSAAQPEDRHELASTDRTRLGRYI
jgi:flagellar hook-length control protein FliK